MRVTDKAYGCCVELLLCNACGLRMPATPIQPAQVVELYKNMDDTVYLRDAKIRGLSNARQVMAILRNFKLQPQSALEIGAGSAYLVQELRKSIDKVEGIEPSRAFCQWAKANLQVELFQGGFEDYPVEARQDLVVALDVIEHVTNPDGFMAALYGHLHPGGLAIVCTPDAGSLVARIMGHKWWHIRPPHIFYFTRRAFRIMARRHGLKVIKEKNFTWTLGLGYLMESIFRLFFGKSPAWITKLETPVPVNTCDSVLFVLQKPKGDTTR